ncbi:MAG: alpha/beta hydrolase [Chloroflexi bacterium]|nr:alpha/beta hydrolase [Chloroflexota bacterium]
MTAANLTEFDLDLASGRLHAQRFGPTSAPLVVCVPGLSANMKSFDFLGERLAAAGTVQVVALDLRGRGRSDVTPPGTYGWRAHARDVLAAATALGAQRFSIIGHSMGAFVALSAACLDSERLERLVLIDAAGVPDPSTAPLISAAVARLGSTYPSVDAYLGQVKQIGTVSPWSDYFERYLRYELVDAADGHGGVRARSSRDAVLEDAAEFSPARDIYALWRCIRQPVLLLRAGRELLPGQGYILSEHDRDRFARDVPSATVVEVDANHYGIITAEATAHAIARFLLSQSGRARSVR